ncbi:brachyurin-like [Calliphora vicina]|uniref:brachyurin-like n=1 Tax=Calliphora vicina TaxID=7373 RepID=UPI00325A65D9
METQYLYQVGILMVLSTLYVIQADQTIAINKRIISGTQAAQGQFPWQVILKVDESDVLLCGGSIISDSWVLTAAHCTYGLQSVFLVFGTIDLFNYEINMTSTAFFMHPEYNDYNFSNDIALIQLPQALKFTSNVQAIAMVTSSQAATGFIGTQATITGFGRTGDASPNSSSVLLWAHLQVVDNSICLNTFGPDYVKDTNICGNAENDSNTSICNGDSGGALVWKNEANSFVQIGINSFMAVNKCSENFPSGFTRLSSYSGFIQNITGFVLN